MKIPWKLKKSTTRKNPLWGTIRSRVGLVQGILVKLLLPMVLIMLVLSLVEVGIGNHALFNNTKLYESTSTLFKTPDFYSLKDMKVEIGKTYYTIKQVVYTFRSVGTQFSKSDGILTQGYFLGMYSRELLIVFVGAVYFLFEVAKSASSGYPLRFRLKENKWWGKGFLLAILLYVLLIVQLLFPLL